MLKISRPMLAATVEHIELLDFPLIASPKIDGIRCVTTPLGPVSRSFKPIRNKRIFEKLRWEPPNLDGELWSPTMTFQEIDSAVMSEYGDPKDIKLWVFDYICNEHHLDTPFEERIGKIPPAAGFFEKVVHTLINSLEELLEYEEHVLTQGFEGVMLRDPRSPYKNGRSTFKQHYLLKLKRFEEAEGIIVGFNQLYSNQNEQKEDAFGNAKRSSHQENLVPMNTLGALRVVNTKHQYFNIGTGFTAEQRQEIWNNQEKYLGRCVTYKSQPHGEKDLPRCPVFKGWRNDL